MKSSGQVVGGVFVKAAVYAVLISYLIVVVFPMVWLFYTSVKPDQEIFLKPFSLPKWGNIEWSNYYDAWVKAKFGRYFGNSVVVTLVSLAASLVVSSMAAYGLARFRFRGNRMLFFLFLSGLMIPMQLTLIPLFFQMRALHLLNTRTGLILVYVAGGIPFSVFILTSFFRSLPAELHEAAVIDGCNEFRAFWHVMLPLARPGLITVAIFNFLGIWNEYFYAFIFLSGKAGEKASTLPLGLANIAIGSQYRSDWGTTFAGLVMVMVPTLLVYIILQKRLVKGITIGALKG